MLIIAELVTYYAKRSNAFSFGQCDTNWYSFTLFVELLPVELFLVAFYLIPRHFFLPAHEFGRSLNDLHLNHDVSVPILVDQETPREVY